MTITPGAGTREQVWRGWPVLDALPELALDGCARAVVVAPHPDDEALAVGGLMARLLAAGVPLVLVAATDGEASHPGSAVMGSERLGEVRPAETARALAALGPGGVETVRLRLPDGGLADAEDALRQALRDVVRPGDWVLAPFEADAHPDHDAAGRAARAVCDETGARLLAYPLWTWHWALPEDPRVPWSRAVRVPLDEDAQQRKAAAVDCYDSQVRPLGPAPQDAAVVPPEVVAHFARPYEVLLA